MQSVLDRVRETIGVRRLYPVFGNSADPWLRTVYAADVEDGDVEQVVGRIERTSGVEYAELAAVRTLAAAGSPRVHSRGIRSRSH